MFQKKLPGVALRIDDFFETKLMITEFLTDRAAAFQIAIGSGEIGHVDRHVMAVIGRNRAIGLAKHQPLLATHLDSPDAILLIAIEHRRRTKNGFIKSQDALYSTPRNEKLHVRDAESHVAEFRLARNTTKSITPRTGY